MIYKATYTLFIISVVIISGCSSSQETIPPNLEPPETFSMSGKGEKPNKWWTVFGDTTLNRFVEKALRSNFNLETAWYRLKEYQAIVDRESASWFPDIEAFFSAEKRDPEFQNGETFSAGLSAEYEVDLWGRINSQVDAAQYRAEASLMNYHTAVLSVSAEITRTWFSLIEYRNQLDLINEQINTNEKVLRLIKARYGYGQIRSVDILRQQQLLQSTIEQKIMAETNIGILEHRLATLLGESPQNKTYYPSRELPELPPLPETGIPADLVKRRPDVISTYNLVRAADEETAAAVAARFPRLSISASIYSSAESVDNLFDSWVKNIAGNILAPIFYGGELSAEADRAEAVKNQRLYEYGQTILDAFREVENALIRETKQEEKIKSLSEQVRLTTLAYEQLQLEYFNGMSDYLDVLTALTEEQRLKRELLSARLELLEYRIALYRALAGSVKTEREV